MLCKKDIIVKREILMQCKLHVFRYTFFFLLLLTIVIIVLFSFRGYDQIEVKYPFEGALFPPEIASPTVIWKDETKSEFWKIKICFQDNDTPFEDKTTNKTWSPSPESWEKIKKRSLEKTALFSISGYKYLYGIKRKLSGSTFSFTTSKDSVEAPIFYRQVSLPFEYAVNNVETIQWCLGDISSYDPPKVVLDDLPVCGNCHSFSLDGKRIGMDVDYANDKGSYIIADISTNIHLTSDKIVTWSDFNRDEYIPTFGLLSQISPDGRYSVSTVKDRSVFVPVDNLYYSQLFFPLKGILAYYDVVTRSFQKLSGADDRKYVQSNPSWSPDGCYIVFAKSDAGELVNEDGSVLLTRNQCEKYLTGGEKFKFDLYRLPFNDGRGGEAVPLKGASDNGMSNYFAKYSPDGKWIVFCKADSFMLLQPDSKLYIMPAEGGEPREMNCNTNEMNSWHSWSPNGRWLVFSSKVFSPYTQLFLTHIDENGNDSPPVLLSRFTPSDRAANIPEFVNIDFNGLERMEEKFVDYYSYFRMGEQSMKQSRYKQAEKLFRKSVALKSDFALAHRKLGSAFVAQNKNDEAFASWQNALKLDPKDALTHQSVGTYYLNSNRLDEAKKSFAIALKLDPHCEPALLGLGLMENIRGNYDASEKKFREATILNPKSEDAYYRLGTLCMERKQYAEAEEAFRKVIEINKDNIDAFMALGFSYLYRMDIGNAEAAFRKAYEKDENNPDICFMLAKVMSTNNERLLEAVELYKKIVALRPTAVEAYINLSDIYLRLGDTASSVEIIHKGIEANPNNSKLILFLNQLR